MAAQNRQSFRQRAGQFEFLAQGASRNLDSPRDPGSSLHGISRVQDRGLIGRSCLIQRRSRATRDRLPQVARGLERSDSHHLFCQGSCRERQRLWPALGDGKGKRNQAPAGSVKLGVGTKTGEVQIVFGALDEESTGWRDRGHSRCSLA